VINLILEIVSKFSTSRTFVAEKLAREVLKSELKRYVSRSTIVSISPYFLVYETNFSSLVRVLFDI